MSIGIGLYDCQSIANSVLTNKGVKNIEEKRHIKTVSTSSTSVKILNRLAEIDMLENNKSKKECQAGVYIDEGLLLLAKQRDIVI
jgi:hypothetical protein